jgi:phosphomannomutase
MFPRVVPTPFVPSAIQWSEGSFGLGVMITASHNPKDDNGYKVYAGNGAQIQDHVAKQIAGFIKTERSFYHERFFSMGSEVVAGDEELMKRVTSWYIEHLREWIDLGKVKDISDGERIVYTALHGVGADYVDEIFSRLFPMNFLPFLVHVEEQRRADPSFPTVQFPNPEEGGATLQLAMHRADELKIKTVFANDPDADRFCVAERSDLGIWRIFNGNEIAVLLADFIARNRSDNGEKCAMLASCVSSRFLGHFCAVRGWHFESTPTGFKNLGNRGIQLRDQGYHVLLSYEEAIGFQIGDWNFDKDGLSTLVAFSLLLNDKEAGDSTDLSSRLESIYEKERCWPVQCNGYYFCRPAAKIKALLSQISTPTNLTTTTKVNSLRNENGTVTIEFDIPQFGAAWLMLRASGTEPKLKFYSELIIEGDSPVPGAGKVLERAVEELIDLTLLPKENNLIKKK